MRLLLDNHLFNQHLAKPVNLERLKMVLGEAYSNKID